jgi:site-specific DNA-methyltransferase (adenine-specific)
MVFSKAKAVYSSNGNIMNYYPQKDKLDKPRHVKKTMYGTKNSTLREGHTIKELGERTYTHKLPKSIIEFSNANIKEKKHPTEKPLDLYKYLLSTYSKEGEIVLDCCAGSGNLGIAALQLKRDYILIEKDEKYFNIIQQRLKENKEVADDK